MCSANQNSDLGTRTAIVAQKLDNELCSKSVCSLEVGLRTVLWCGVWSGGGGEVTPVIAGTPACEPLGSAKFKTGKQAGISTQAGALQ